LPISKDGAYWREANYFTIGFPVLLVLFLPATLTAYFLQQVVCQVRMFNVAGGKVVTEGHLQG